MLSDSRACHGFIYPGPSSVSHDKPFLSASGAGSTGEIPSLGSDCKGLVCEALEQYIQSPKVGNKVDESKRGVEGANYILTVSEQRPAVDGGSDRV